MFVENFELVHALSAKRSMTSISPQLTPNVRPTLSPLRSVVHAPLVKPVRSLYAAAFLQPVSLISKLAIQAPGLRSSRTSSVMGRERALQPKAKRRKGLMNISRLWRYEKVERLFVGRCVSAFVRWMVYFSRERR